MNNTYSSSHLLIDECKRLRKSIQPISSKYEAQRLFSAYNNNTYYPIVLLLGNHSSGKSSFINYLLQRKVQTTGVAPTDDNFTIIGPSNEDIDRNGPALVGDPDLGFSELKSFGPVLVNHTQLKLRSNIAITDFMIVDSPGMIDSPNKNAHTHYDKKQQPVGMDRGYNFQGVCKWYAERADVILLFFDPDKPGTTGETLSILTSSLVGLDHKMYIILNKADQFNKIHDFARAYGSLCWNLSKVIPRKDLPRIHTMCLPLKSTTTTTINRNDNVPTNTAVAQSIDNNTTSSSSSSVVTSLDIVHSNTNVDNQSDKAIKTFFQQGIHDLEESRSEVIRETLNAPKRRVDNEISRLTESVSALLMHCTIVDRMLAIYQDKLWRGRGIVFFTVLSSIGITMATNYLCDYLFEDSHNSITTGSNQDHNLSNNTTINKPSDKRITTTSSSPPPSVVVKASPTISTNTHNNNSSNSIYDRMNHQSTPSGFVGLWKIQSKAAVMLWTSLSGIIISGIATLYQKYSLQSLLESFQEQSYSEDIYRQLYKQEIADGDESILGMGKLVLNGLAQVMHPSFVQSSSRIQKFEFHALQRVLTEDIAILRRKTSPVFQSLSPPHNNNTTGIMMTPTSSISECMNNIATLTNSTNTKEKNMIHAVSVQRILSPPRPSSDHKYQYHSINGDEINRNNTYTNNIENNNSFNNNPIHVSSNDLEGFTSNNNNNTIATINTNTNNNLVNIATTTTAVGVGMTSDSSETITPESPPSRKKAFTTKENKIEELIAKYNKILTTPTTPNSNNRKSITKTKTSQEFDNNNLSINAIHYNNNNNNSSSYDGDDNYIQIDPDEEEENEEDNKEDEDENSSNEQPQLMYRNNSRSNSRSNSRNNSARKLFNYSHDIMNEERVSFKSISSNEDS